MPSKGRWALNPRKWFGTISNAAHKREEKSQMNTVITSLPSTKLGTISPSTSTVPRVSIVRNKTKVLPASSINDHNYVNFTTPISSFTQFHLPPFHVRREKTSTLIAPTSTLMTRTNTFIPARTEPSIRKNVQSIEPLSIDTTQWATETIVYETSKLLLTPSISSPYGNFSQSNLINKQSEINLSNVSSQCLVDYPRNSSSNFNEKCSSSTRTQSSSSSLDENDEQDRSSSSGVFTDERTDVNDQQRTASKDTLSTLDVISMDSIMDSQISLNHCQSRPRIFPYRLPMPIFETIDKKPVQIERESPTVRSNRAHSAEGILKDNQVSPPLLTKPRQSSAAIVKKIEKRIPTSRSPPATLEKAGFVRVANDTYRLTRNKDNHLYHQQRKNSIVQYSNFDDSLPPADNEECYARLPRISSTEQLNNNNIQNDLRAVVDDYLRPMFNSINKTTYRTIKSHHRSKRSHTNNEPVQINLDDITDKLLSSIDCSTYTQYQRCY